MTDEGLEQAATGRDLRAFAASLQKTPPNDVGGRGLVMCAGGTRLLTCAWVTLSFLRRDLGSTLPVQLWHLGEAELGATEASLFATLEVECVDALEVRRTHPARILGGWELKPYAAVRSPFAEVVLLDADSLPLVDPAVLFEEEQYLEHGARFWPDVVRMEAANEMWELCGVPFRSEAAWESGQAVIDKRRCWAELQTALWMNMHSDVFYRHSHGDKDTFHLAWRMHQTPVAMTRYPPKVTPSGLTQRSDDGEPVFQHRSTAKWLLHGENVRDVSFRHEAQCLEYLEALRQRWSGRVDAIPARSDGDQELERWLTATRWFTLSRRGWDERTVELLEGHRVGAGATAEERRWWVRDGVLEVAGDHGVTCRLTAQDPGVWAGTWEAPPHHAVVLAVSEDDPATTLVTALLDGLACGRATRTDIVTTLATIRSVTAAAPAFAQARARHAEDAAALDVLLQAEARAGARDPSLLPHGAAAGHRYVGG